MPPMKHARDAASPAPARGRRRGKGRHAATEPRRRPSSALSAWPVRVGAGLVVAVATTTSFSVVAPGIGTPGTHGGAPDAAAPTGQTPSPAAAAPSPAAAGSAQAAVGDREGAASRTGERSAPAAKAASGAKQGLVVPSDVTMSVEGVGDAAIEKAPPPPVLPGCDGEAAGSGSNGQIPESEMCVLWDGSTAIRADAAVALARLNKAYTATFGEPMCITDGYRSYAQQVATKAAKGYLAAAPGTSNHGWGLAVDICPESYAGDRWDWLAANAPAYGWDNPPWARPGGSKYEPWHWEFTAAVAEMGGA